MAIGTPVAIVGAAVANANSGSANGTVTTVAAPVGSLVFIAVGNASSNNTITVFNDSAGNDWNIFQSNAGSLVANGAICWTIVGFNMPIGTSFTASTTGGQWNFDGGWKVSGCNSGTDNGVLFTGLTGGNSTGLSQSTGTLFTANELIIGQTTIDNTVTYTESSGFTNLFGSGAASNGGIAYQIVSSTASVAFAPSWTIASNPVAWQLIAFKISAVGTATGLGAAPGIGADVLFTTGAAAGIGAGPGIGAALWAEKGTANGTATAVGLAVGSVIANAAGVGAAPGIGMGAMSSAGTALAAGTATAPAIGLATIAVTQRVVGWFDEWDQPPPPIRRNRLTAIQRVQRNNGWLNAGRIFRGLNKSTKRMRRDQNFRYEDEDEDEDARG